MAKASVATLFRAFLFADRAREKMIMRMGNGKDLDAAIRESGMSYGQALVSSSELEEILQGCDLEIEIPPSSGKLFERVVEKVSQTDREQDGSGPPEGWQH